MSEERNDYNPPISMGQLQLPSALGDDLKESLQLIKVLTEHDNFLNIVRRELMGVQLYQEESGETYWVQVDKPRFVKLNKENKPIKVFNKKTNREEYVCNDDAVNEIINLLKMCGLNPVTPVTNIPEEEIRADLFEMESKLAVLLTLKRKEWGIDKSAYPVVVGELKVLIKDARYRAKDGVVLKALRTITTRMEQTRDDTRNKSIGERIKAPFQ